MSRKDACHRWEQAKYEDFSLERYLKQSISSESTEYKLGHQIWQNLEISLKAQKANWGEKNTLMEINAWLSPPNTGFKDFRWRY